MSDLNNSLLVNNSESDEDSVLSNTLSSSGSSFLKSWSLKSPASSSSSKERVSQKRKPARDPAAIERSNLVNISKLVVKELLEQSIRFGRMLDSDHLPLQHFFIVLEHVLRHGLRSKKGLLGPKKELWDLLQSVEKICPESQDITQSVRDLPTVRTHIGRARAWLRIALMQKKLADYLHALIENRDEILFEYYEPHALMMSEEVVVIMGILVGLNVIDCNLCVKEEDLDSQQGVIDFSLYLRSSTKTSPEEDQSDDLSGNMTAVLDQKNYIEELNRHLNATVGNLQAKIESLTTTNALMKEDLAIARNSVLAVTAENQALRQTLASGPSIQIETQSSSSDKSSSDTLDALSEERRKNAELEKEVKLQISLKAETDMAMKLLEKDIHEKQDTIVSLRRQLDDIKGINLEMYKKLQECEASLKLKTELLSRLECQKDEMTNTIANIEQKWTSDKSSLGEILRDTSQSLSQQVTESKELAARAMAEVRIERQWRQSLQEKEERLREQISKMESWIEQLNNEIKSHEKTKFELARVSKLWSDAQLTLEELGIQLSDSKLKIIELQDRILNNEETNSNFSESVSSVSNSGTLNWVPDRIATHCKACAREFGLTRRKHHCRNCGDIFCKNCSSQSIVLPRDDRMKGKVRVCDKCYDLLKKP